jgi:hypothetical protein
MGTDKNQKAKVKSQKTAFLLLQIPYLNVAF